MGKPHRCRRIKSVDLDPAEVGVLLHLASRQLETGNRRSRGRALREMDLRPLGVEVVAGLDAPADDGEARVLRRRLEPERNVRVQELRLLPPGFDELPQEAGRRIGVRFGAHRERAKSARRGFRRDAGKRRCACARSRSRCGGRQRGRVSGPRLRRRSRRGPRRRFRRRCGRGRTKRKRAGERTAECEQVPSQERRPLVHPIDRSSPPGRAALTRSYPCPPAPGAGRARPRPVRRA